LDKSTQEGGEDFRILSSWTCAQSMHKTLPVDSHDQLSTAALGQSTTRLTMIYRD